MHNVQFLEGKPLQTFWKFVTEIYLYHDDDDDDDDDVDDDVDDDDIGRCQVAFRFFIGWLFHAS